MLGSKLDLEGFEELDGGAHLEILGVGHLVRLVEGGVGRHPSALDGTECEATLLDTRYELEARGGHAVIGAEEVAAHVIARERRSVVLRI